MIAHDAYRQQRQPSLPRIDLILTCYDTLIEHVERAREGMSAVSEDSRGHLAKAQALVTALASGLDPKAGEPKAGELATNFLRLYEFVSHCLADGSPARIGDALEVLRSLREGFETIRPQAADLERSGQIPPLSKTAHLVQATA